LDAPCAELYALHREVEGKQVYFLANSSGERVTRSVTFRSGGRAEQWHPTTGAIEPLETGTSAGISTVSLEFAPFEGYFVVFGRQ
jgi:hypothetical protein